MLEGWDFTSSDTSEWVIVSWVVTILNPLQVGWFPSSKCCEMYVRYTNPRCNDERSIFTSMPAAPRNIPQTPTSESRFIVTWLKAEDRHVRATKTENQMITSKVDFGQTIYVYMFYTYLYIEVVNHVAWLLLLIYLNLFFFKMSSSFFWTWVFLTIW